MPLLASSPSPSRTFDSVYADYLSRREPDTTLLASLSGRGTRHLVFTRKIHPQSRSTTPTCSTSTKAHFRKLLPHHCAPGGRNNHRRHRRRMKDGPIKIYKCRRGAEKCREIVTASHDLGMSVPVPPLFRCPISLELMSDPVSLCTGVTYDRASIQKWLLQGNNVCPATGQVLQSPELIPNRTLRSLIQKWCQTSENRTPEATAETESVRKLVKKLENGIGLDALRSLKNLAAEESNRRVMKEEGVLSILVRVVEEFEDLEEVQEAVGVIALFDVEDVNARRGPAIRALDGVLARGSVESRMSAAAIVEKVARTDKYAAKEIGSVDGVTEGLLNLFQDNIISYPLAVKASLKALLPLCSVVRSRATIAKAVGAVCALIELLPGAERGVAEQALAVLEALSATGEGRCAIMGHALAVATIVRSLLVVSDTATDHGVRILLAICFNCGEEEVLREVVEMGAFEKLLVLLQMECGLRTKHHANQLLRILARLRQDNNESFLKSSSIHF